MDETSGTVLADSSGHGRDGTLVGGGATLGVSMGLVGLGLLTAGNGGYVSGPNFGGLISSAWAMEIWLELASAPGIADATLMTDNGFIYNWINTGPNLTGYDFRSGNGARSAASSSSLSLTTLHQAVFMADTASGGKYYIDGVAAGTFTPGGSGNWADTNNPSGLVIGSEGGSRPLVAKVAHAQVYDHVLTAGRVLAHFNAGMDITSGDVANQDAVLQVDENIGLEISAPSPDVVVQMDENIGVELDAADPSSVLQMDEYVVPTSVGSIEVLPSTAQSLLVGQTLQLTALATQEDDSSIEVTSVVDWPDLTPLASINSDGLLTALAHGQIAAGEEVILGAFTALLPAFDLLGLVVSIEITPADATFDEDGDVTFVATATYDDDSTSDLSDKVVWAADPPIITIVNGVVTRGPYGGVVTVTATSEDYMP